MYKSTNWIILRPKFIKDNTVKGDKIDIRLHLLQQVKAYQFIKLNEEGSKIFIDETYSSAPGRNYPTNKIVYNHIDDIWPIDLDDIIDYKISNIKGFGCIFVIIDNYSKYLWAGLLKNKKISDNNK